MLISYMRQHIDFSGLLKPANFALHILTIPILWHLNIILQIIDGFDDWQFSDQSREDLVVEVAVYLVAVFVFA